MNAAAAADAVGLSHFCDALPGFALLVAHDGLVLHANAQAAALFGDVCGRPCPLPPPQPPDATMWEWKSDARLYRLVRIRGKWADDRPYDLYWGQDASDLAKLRDALGRSRRQFEAIVGNVMEGVVIAANGRLVYVNPFMERLTGHDAATLCGTSFAAFLHPEDREGVLASHKRRLAGEATPAGQVFRILTRSGAERWIQAVSARIEWEDVPASLSLLSDITPQRQAQLALAALLREQESLIARRTARLREANQTLEEANVRLSREIEEHERTAEKLIAARRKAGQASKAKSAFLANMSHEIRTPLNVILGMADLALRPESRGEKDHMRALEMIREAGTSLRALLDDLLDLSRIEAGRLRLESVVFSPRRVLDVVLEGHALLAGRRDLILEGHVAADVPESLYGDPGRLGQVLGNLVGNALKFTPSGRIDVFLRCGAPGTGEEPETAQDVELVFAVRDTGVGIDPARQKTIFQSFRQADASISRQYGGSGLGLAICRRLVRLLGGRISVSSRPGQGSEFTFTARFVLPPEGASRLPGAADAATLAGASALPPLEILLAEDSDLSAEMIVTFLTRKGHHVTRAANGREALDALAVGRFDLALMDIRMPVLDGLAAIRAIREGRVEGCDPDLPIVALTAHGAPRDRQRILAAGATDYLSKPVSLDGLLEVLARIAAPQPGRGGQACAAAPDRERGVGDGTDTPFDAGRTTALENLGGDVELYDRLVAVFLRDTPEDLAQLRAALQSGDRERTALFAHALKGNAGLVGASRAAAQARALEQAARGDLCGDLAPLTRRLEAALTEALQGFAAQGIRPAAL